MDTSDWGNSVFLKDIEGIKKLKSSEGSDIQVHGSSQLIQLLLKNDLVDETLAQDIPADAWRREKAVWRRHDSGSLYINR